MMDTIRALGLIVLTTLAVECVTDDALRMRGDVTLGVLVETRTWDRHTRKCGERQQGLMESVEAVRWFVDRLNQQDFVPGVTLGLEVLETCGNEEKATEQLLELLDSHSPQSNSSLIGVLGPTSSSETAYVTRVLSALPSSKRPPLVSVSATATRLTADAAEAGNFFRVISPDNIQVEVMVELMKTLSWNYVAVVYEDLLYGREGATSLRDLLRASGTACVAVFESIPPSGDNVQDINKIVDTIRSEQVSGVVLFSGTTVARNVFLQARNLGLENVAFILSEAVYLRPPDFDFPPSWKILVTSPPFSSHSGFADHWAQVFSNQTARTQVSSENPFITGIDLSSVEAERRSVYVRPAMTGVLVLADAYKRLHSASCSGPGLCDSLREAGLEKLVDQVNKTSLSLAEEGLGAGLLTFDSGEAKMSGDHPLYQVFQFRNKDFVKIADYRQPRRLTLVEGISHGVESSQCPSGRECSLCLKSNLSEAVFMVPGEHYIVVVVPIHEEKKGEPLMCGNFLPKISADLAEAANFAVSMLNQRQDSRFQNRLRGSLGLLVINSCNSPLVLEQRLLALHSGKLPLVDGRNSAELASKIVGYVGALGTALSLPMAAVLDRLGFVQISYGSTGISLSNREIFRYFMRLVTPDDQQAEAVLSLVSKLGSNYIQIIYSKEAYGREGKDAIVAKARQYGVCVANEIGVEDTQESYYGIKDELFKFPSAKLVVLFVRTHMVIQVLQTLRDANVLTRFSWLGSETWGRRSDLLSVEGTEGAITLVLEAPLLSELETHIRGQNLTSTSDPWLRKYVEERLSCFLPGSFNRSTGQACGEPWSRFPSDQFIQDAWAPYLVYGVYALALGWDQALREECANSRDSLPCPRLTPARLVHHVKQVRLDLQVRGQADKLFDDNGDGTGGYGVVQVVRRDGRLKFDRRGSWRPGEGLTTSAIQHEPSTCPNEVTCQQCLAAASGETMGERDASVPVVASLSVIIVLLVVAFIVLLVLFIRMKRKVPKEGSADPMVFYNEVNCPSIPPPPCGPSSTGSRVSTDSTYISPKFEYPSEGRLQPRPRADSELSAADLEADGTASTPSLV